MLWCSLDNNPDDAAVLERPDDCRLPLSQWTEWNGAFMLRLSLSLSEQFMDRDVVSLKETEHGDLSSVA